jgi:hypothetical protein
MAVTVGMALSRKVVASKPMLAKDYALPELGLLIACRPYNDFPIHAERGRDGKGGKE